MYGFNPDTHAQVLSPSEIPTEKDTKLFKASLALPVSEHLCFDFPGQSMDFPQASKLQESSAPFLTVSQTSPPLESLYFALVAFVVPLQIHVCVKIW